VSGIRYASVFKYYGNAVEDGLDPIAFCGVTATAVAFAAIGAWLFDRRDLAGQRQQDYGDSADERSSLDSGRWCRIN
jgi:hypothetical protein